MKSSTSNLSCAMGQLLLLQSIDFVASHGYLSTPRSRNYAAWLQNDWSDTSSNSPLPEFEDCPHCLNLGGTIARCGYNGRNYDEPLTRNGKLMPFVTQATYVEGSEIDIETTITAYHKGHFEFKVCALDSSNDVADQDCFDRHPLTFVKDMLYGAGKDEAYPYRVYLAGEYDRFVHRMKLPPGVSGSTVLLQWHWLTANSCSYPGYVSYYQNQPSLEESIGLVESQEECPELPPDGRGVPEQFWNCAEITIKSKGADQTEEQHLSTSNTSTHATISDEGDSSTSINQSDSYNSHEHEQAPPSITATHATIGDQGDGTSPPCDKRCKKDKKDKFDTISTDEEEVHGPSSSSHEQTPPCDKKCKKDKKNKLHGTSSDTDSENDSNEIASEQVPIDNKNSTKGKKDKDHGAKRDSLLPQDVVIHHQYAHHESSKVKNDKNDFNDANSVEEMFHHQSKYLTDEEIPTETVSKKKRKGVRPPRMNS